MFVRDRTWDTLVDKRGLRLHIPGPQPRTRPPPLNANWAKTSWSFVLKIQSLANFITDPADRHTQWRCFICDSLQKGDHVC